MQKEAANELMGVECHCLPAIGAIEAIVFPSEGDASVIGGDQPPVGNGDAMRVARQVAEHGFRPSEWLLGVDDPLDLLERRDLWQLRLSQNRTRAPLMTTSIGSAASL